jgi:hypothetical protein
MSGVRNAGALVPPSKGHNSSAGFHTSNSSHSTNSSITTRVLPCQHTTSIYLTIELKNLQQQLQQQEQARQQWLQQQPVKQGFNGHYPN